MGFFLKTRGEFQIQGAFGSEEFEGHKTVEGALSGLVDDAHAAASQALENFEVRKMWRERFGGKRRGRSKAGFVDGWARDSRHQTLRAEASWGVGRKGSRALGAE